MWVVHGARQNRIYVRHVWETWVKSITQYVTSASILESNHRPRRPRKQYKGNAFWGAEELMRHASSLAQLQKRITDERKKQKNGNLGKWSMDHGPWFASNIFDHSLQDYMLHVRLRKTLGNLHHLLTFLQTVDLQLPDIAHDSIHATSKNASEPIFLTLKQHRLVNNFQRG